MARPIPTDKGTNYGGANLTISSNQSLTTSYYNVGTFTVNAGVTLTITATDVWQIKANTINILGNISADAIIIGGAGVGGNGYVPIGGNAGGGGGSYGGSGTSGSALYGANPGGAGTVYGSPTDVISDYIDVGSSGGYGYASFQNKGGAIGRGGGGIYLYASGNVVISGNISANGESAGCTVACSGGGSGGGIIINGYSITINSSAGISVIGGIGGSGSNLATGGTGGGGRIKMVSDNPIIYNSNSIVGASSGLPAPNNGTFYIYLVPGNLTIYSTPAGAEIYLALAPGTPVDQGVVTQPGGTTLSNLTSGTYNVRLTYPGYQDWIGTIAVIGDQTVSLNSIFAGSAKFSSNPVGTTIWIDGTNTGVVTPGNAVNLTPQTSDGTQPTRSHNYTLKLAGYADMAGSFTATAGSTITIPLVTFLPSASFVTTPPGANIYIDNILQSGLVTPVIVTGLSVGSHNYKLTLAGYADYTGSFTTASASISYITATFAGSANFSSIPTGSEIYIAVSPNTPVDQGIVTPKIITGLTSPTAGSNVLYNYLLAHIGYINISGQFTATAGQNVPVPVSFPPSVNFVSSPTGAEIYLALAPGTPIDQGVTTAPGSAGGTTIVNLSVGTYNYILKLTGYPDVTGSFTTVIGQTSYISASFTGNLNIASTPAGAEIYLALVGSGIPVDQGVITKSGSAGGTTISNLIPGTYNIRLTLAGYQDWTGTATIIGNQTVPVVATFAPSVSFISTPSGAEIYLVLQPGTPIDQGVVTQTGGTILAGLSIGTYNYTLRLSGYQDITGTFTTVAGQTSTVQGIFTGNLSISSNPVGASIYLDGSTIPVGVTGGLSSPLVVTGLVAGSHTYTLTLTGYATLFNIPFSISPGVTTQVAATFAGSAQFTSIPAGASVYLDGSTTPSGITSSDLSNPLIVLNLTPPVVGSTQVHSYVLKLVGYADFSGQFTATAGQMTTIGVTFLPSTSIVSAPSGASIYIDNILQSGLVTPATITGLSVGSHNYKLTLTGYADYTGSLNTVAGSTTPISVSFAGSANFSSTPTGAEIYLAQSPGTPIDQLKTTPRIITNLTNAAAGASVLYNYLMKLGGYADVSGQFTATAGQTVSISGTFPGSVQFTSNPTGAEIWIDGSDTGLQTPYTITNISAGTHGYTLKLANYADISSTFVVTTGTITQVVGIFLGSALFTSTPSGASIYIDNILQTGITTPGIVKGLSARSHNYILKLAGYQDVVGSFTATSGTIVGITVTFSSNVNFVSNPSGAEIWIDYSGTGDYTDIGEKTPATILGIPVGTFNYKLTIPEYADYIDVFTTAAGQTTYTTATFAGSTYFTTDPSGASIYLDGSITSIGVTPLIATGLTSQTANATSNHTYILSLAGSPDVTGSFTATAGTIAQVTGAFPGSVHITSTPPGADIWIDYSGNGDYTDTGEITPATVSGLPSGQYNYILKLAGYLDYTDSFSVASGQTTPVGIIFSGSMHIISNPTGAEIWVDGVDTGLATPNTVIGLTTGTSSVTHNYTLKLAGFADMTGVFSVSPGTTTPLSVTFPGSASFESSPHGAEIWIDYTGTGVYTDTGQVTSATGGLGTAITGLSVGSYNYIIRLAGYLDYTGSFTIATASITYIYDVFAGSTHFISSPPGVSVYLDGSNTPVGITPITIVGLTSPSSGDSVDHTYILRLAGYADITGTFSAVAGQTVSVYRSFPGSVYITSIPSGAEIWVDNIDTGLVTPNTITGLSEGSHSYMLTISGYGDTTGTFNIIGGQIIDAPIIFPGSAYITSTPPGASVYLDGKLITISNTPLTVINLTLPVSGDTQSHSYRMVLQGYKGITGDFIAIAGQTVNVPGEFVCQLPTSSFSISK